MIAEKNRIFSPLLEFQRVLFLLLFLSPLLLTSQTIENDFIVEKIEQIAERYESEVDMTDLMARLTSLIENPAEINSGDPDENRRILLLNEIQAYNLAAYVYTTGPLLSYNELLAIEGFSPQLIEDIIPFITLQTTTKQPFSFKKLFSRGRNRVLTRYQRVLEPQKGYTTDVYHGSPDKFYLRYDFQTKYIKAGVVGEKDAGETFGAPCAPYGFDFLSFHALYSGKGIIQKVAIGDYHLHFGQGLTMWSGLTLGKSSDAFTIKKYGSGVRKSASTNENGFFRGVATTLKYKKWHATLFASSNKIDARLDLDQGDSLLSFESLDESGFHRTESELLKKDALTQQVAGGRISWKGGAFVVGATAFNTSFNEQMRMTPTPYKLFDFYGNSLQNYGIDFSTVWKKSVFFGEVGYSSFGGLGAIAGFQTLVTQRIHFAALYRNYSKKYVNFFSNAFAENSRSQNEEGLYFGIQFLLHKSWSLNGYVDLFRFPWLKYQMSAPTTGREMMAQLNFFPNRNVDCYIRYKFEEKQKDSSGSASVTPSLIPQKRESLRFHISLSPLQNLKLKTRFEHQQTQQGKGETHHGYLFYQDISIVITPKINGSFRYAYFNTYSYNERIYAYENDVLYAFSVPAYYYTGSRIYFVMKYKLNSTLSFWGKISTSLYNNRDLVGSSYDEIEGNHRTEVRLQLQVKL